MAQRQNEKEFMELKLIDNVTVMQYASKSAKLSRFSLEFVSFERFKKRRFEEGLEF